MLMIEIYDEVKFLKSQISIKINIKYNIMYFKKSFTNDEMVAFVKYPLPDSLFNGIFLDEWIPLSGKLGEQKEGHINVQIMYTVWGLKKYNLRQMK